MTDESFVVPLEEIKYAITLMHDDGFDGLGVLKIAQVVRALTGLGLKESKELVEQTIEDLYAELETA